MNIKNLIDPRKIRKARKGLNRYQAIILNIKQLFSFPRAALVFIHECLRDNVIPVEMTNCNVGRAVRAFGSQGAHGTPYQRNLILNEDVYNDERAA